MKELSSHKRRRRDVCTFGPEFEERLKAIRLKLGIPQGGFPKEVCTVLGPPEKGFPKKESFYPQEATTRWYTEHVQQTTGKRREDLPRNPPSYYWYFPREIAELINDFAYSTQPCRPGFHPEVPLDRYAMDLVREFGLPEDVVNNVKRRILVQEAGSLGRHRMLQPIPIAMEGRDGPYFCVLISGVDGSTAKKDWEDIWEQLKSQMKQKGWKIAPPKRDEEKIEVRDLTWWGWSQEDMSAGQILDKWSEKHPEDKRTCHEDAVRAAIKRIEEIMRPIAQNGL